MFRSLKAVFQILVLLWTGWLISSVGVGWEVGVFLAILFISGPEGLELYLVRQGILSDARDANE